MGGTGEGDILVLDVTTFSQQDDFRGSTGNLHSIERFTRVAPGEIQSEFTVDDPTTFTCSWSARDPHAACSRANF